MGAKLKKAIDALEDLKSDLEDIKDDLRDAITACDDAIDEVEKTE